MVRDKTTTCGARIQDQKHSKNKHLKQGKFVQIMKANVDRTLKQIILEKDTIVIIGFMCAFKTLTKRPILVFKKTRIHSPPKHVSLSFSFKPIRSNQGL